MSGTTFSVRPSASVTKTSWLHPESQGVAGIKAVTESSRENETLPRVGAVRDGVKLARISLDAGVRRSCARKVAPVRLTGVAVVAGDTISLTSRS